MTPKGTGNAKPPLQTIIKAFSEIGFDPTDFDYYTVKDQAIEKLKEYGYEQIDETLLGIQLKNVQLEAYGTNFEELTQVSAADLAMSVFGTFYIVKTSLGKTIKYFNYRQMTKVCKYWV